MMTSFFILLKQELLLVLLIFILLFIKLGKERSNETLLTIINSLLVFNFVIGLVGNEEGYFFGGIYFTDQLLSFEKSILNAALLIISMQSYGWLKNHQQVIEFYILLLSSLLGMFFMISSENLLMFYLGLELSSIPLAAASNFDLDKRVSSEAAMKMIISSAFSSALLLLGISFIYGVTGSISFSEIAGLINTQPLSLFAFLLLFSGFAFKVSAVPFHLWTADVYEGAPVAVTSFFSVVSKAAVVFVLVNVLYKVFGSLLPVWYNLLFVLSIATIVVGNLFAIRQNNLKRFLAFSSIAQVGFLLIGISAGSQSGMASVIYFIVVYLFSNLAAFGVISLVSASSGKETISSYASFYSNNKLLTWVLTIALFSLAGVPPTAGFFGKFFLLIAGAAKGNYVLIVIAALNMVISFYYYLRIVKSMFMDSNDQPIEKIVIPFWPKLSLYICLAGIVLVGVLSFVYQYIYSLSTGI